MVGLASGPIDASQQAILFYLYFDSIKRTRAALEELGYSPGEIKHPFYMPGGECRLEDPDGYVLMLAQMQPGAMLINTGRGGLVDAAVALDRPLRAQLGEVAGQLDVLAHRQERQQVELLEDHAQLIGAETITRGSTERVHRLPHTVFCYAPEADYPYPVYDQAHAQRPLTFGSFNNVPKLTPHTIALWAKVLARVPGSRLLLKAPSFRDESAIRIFRERFVQQGVDASRIEFRGPVGLADMMAEYADVDIALDPVPYNGGTTSLQAMWMGVPVLTQMGAHFVSRMGASFMTAAGLPEWVA